VEEDTAACRSHGAVDFWKGVFERVLKLHDSHGGNHTRTSNLFTTRRGWG
jgi:hypothetical protein